MSHLTQKNPTEKSHTIILKKCYFINVNTNQLNQPEVTMTSPDMNKINYARALIRAGITQDLILKITLISRYQYVQIQRELMAA